ncbi:MAG: SagB/ThcOx family dehydrogenase, partial [Desulfovibrionales bacterium]|nr:SagB/ThcOx family dehydrogenase [Desulfovibrionales bacterium]
MSGVDYRKNREFLKDSLRKKTDFSITDQNRGVPAPPVQKSFDPQDSRVKLCERQDWKKVISDI